MKIEPTNLNSKTLLEVSQQLWVIPTDHEEMLFKSFGNKLIMSDHTAGRKLQYWMFIVDGNNLIFFTFYSKIVNCHPVKVAPVLV